NNLCEMVVSKREFKVKSAKLTSALAGVSTMVLNVYRGILNVLQLNIKKTHNIYELQEVCQRSFSTEPRSVTGTASLSKSRSSAASFEALTKQNKFLGNEAPPAFAIIIRAVRADNKVMGYQLAVYSDKPSTRLQIILAALAADNNWKLCADGALLSKHKVTAKVSWGAECKQYDTMITAETGLIGPSPAARVRVAWKDLPSTIKRYAKKVYDLIPANLVPGLIKEKEKNSANQLSLAVIATSDKTIDLIWKSPTVTIIQYFSQNFKSDLFLHFLSNNCELFCPQRTVYKLALHLPYPLPLDGIKGLTPFDGLADQVHFLFAKAAAGKT
uniref:Vitellinogen beta-sheet shell domain-containing protein n=1 Tax=Sparus aurata TaxID=8175 RepID=A0A671V7K6_SPAAU